jgi:fengycin family lipopeptide synthetase B
MSDISARLAALSPEKLQSLAERLLVKPSAIERDQIRRYLARPALIPLSYSQEGAWSLDRLGLVGAAYNEVIALRVEGNLDDCVLERCLREIIRRHEILRTRIETTPDGQGAQVIDQIYTPSFDIIDLSSVNAEAREAELQRRLQAESLRVLNLAQGPLFRASLLKLAAHDQVLCLVVHHILFDGWSMGILLDELRLLYTAYSEGRQSPLPELRVQYADYALWQRDHLKRGGLDNDLAYWRERLGGVLPVLELPTDRPRPKVPSFRGSEIWFSLPRELTSAVDGLSRQEGTTLFMTLLATFQVLLSRWTGMKDIIVGSPTANRARRPTESLIGFFVNTVVMRTNLSGDPSFQELLHRVKEVALSAYAHQGLPIDKVVAELQPDRNLSRQSLFQVMFVLQNQTPGDGRIELPGATLRFVGVGHTTSKFDLTMECFETPTELSGRIEYASDLFDDATISRFVDNFKALLTEVVLHPTRRISELSLLSEAQRHQLLVEWNGVTTSLTREECIHRVFEERVRCSPKATVLTFENSNFSYEDLNERANRLAHYLLSLGAEPEVRIGICAERSLDLVVSILAILKAGCAYVPLDPAYPRDRLSYIIEDSQVSLLLTQASLLDQLPPISTTVVCIDRDWNEIAQQPGSNPITTASAANLAYIIYTSGSTGRPKGVMVTHGNVLRLFQCTEPWFKFSEQDVWSLFHSCSFDFSVWELWGALLYAGRLVIVPYWVSRSPNEFLALIGKERVTVLNQTPSAFQQLMRAAQGRKCTDHSLRWVIFGGEVLDYSSLRTWFEERPLGEPQLVNMYGITETTVHVTYRPITRQDVEAPKAWSRIGQPIPDLETYVLDSDMNCVPVGVWGELYVGGKGLARGYLNRPDLTAQRFVPNCFEKSPGARLYRTGDVVRWQATGDLEYLGRSDQQVKIRGHRIELGEIEAVLLQHSEVRECAVIVQEENGHKQLVAYVVLESMCRTQEATDLRVFLLKSLPEYMVPTMFVFLKALPLTANGKLDRKAMPSAGCGEQSRRALMEPRSASEQALVRIWAEVLNRERVGVEENFFEMGGDSIVAIQVVAHAAQAGIRITVRDMFEHQTIAELAVIAGTQRAIDAEQCVVEGAVPLTPIQRWFFEGNPPDPSHFNQSIILQCRRRLAVPTLRDAVKQLVAHHDALRLRFRQTTSGWEQWNSGLDEQDDSACEYIDVSQIDLSKRNIALTQAAQRLQTSLDICRGPLLRVALFELGPTQAQRLLLVIHHLAVDGVSLRILVEDLQVIYEELERNEVVQLAPKTTSFKSWAERLEAYAKLEEVQAEAHYWRGLPWRTAASLPRNERSGSNTVESSRSLTVVLGRMETTTLLQEAQRVYGAHINDLLLSALLEALGDWTGQHVFMIDLEGHGREELFSAVDISRTVGWFTSLFPVLLDVSACVGARQIVDTVKEQLLRLPYRGLVYGILRYFSQCIATDDMPAPEISFNYLGQFGTAASQDALFRPSREAIGSLCSSRGKRRHLIEIDGAAVDDCLQFTWTYSTSMHEHSTVQAVAERFLESLQQLADIHMLPGYNHAFSTAPELHLQQLNGDKCSADVCGGELLSQDIAETELEGKVPLTPIQRSMLVRCSDLFHRNIVMLGLECGQRLAPALLMQALNLLIAHHDSLRLKLLRTGAGWEQSIAAADALREEQVFEYIDLSTLGSPAEQEDAIQQARTQLTALIKDSAPPLLRAALIDLGADSPQRLLVGIHHLGVDAFSLDILFEDLQKAYEQLSKSRPVTFPAKTASFRTWARQLASYAKSPAILAEIAYWRGLPWESCANLPRDYPHDENKGQSLKSVDYVLDAATMRALLQVQRKYAVQMNELMLTALVNALSICTARRTFCIEFLDYGRVASFEGARIDCSRTVGWFATEVPAVLDGRDAPELEDLLKAVKQQLRKVPNQGIGYGVLRYMCENEFLTSLPAPAVRLNHMGTAGARALGGWIRKHITPKPEILKTDGERPKMVLTSRENEFLHRQIDLYNFVFDDNGGGMMMSWLYDGNVHSQRTIESLAENLAESLRMLSRRCDKVLVAV